MTARQDSPTPPPLQHRLYWALAKYHGVTQQALADEASVPSDKPARQQTISDVFTGKRPVPRDPPPIDGADLSAMRFEELELFLDYGAAYRRAENGINPKYKRRATDPTKRRRMSRAFYDAMLAVEPAGNDESAFAVMRLLDPIPTDGRLPVEPLDPPVRFAATLAGREAADAEAARRNATGDGRLVVVPFGSSALVG